MCEQRHCGVCISETLHVENDELCFVCTQCGTVDKSSRDFDIHVPYPTDEPYWKRRKFSKHLIDDDSWKFGDSAAAAGRYKEKFHWNERVSQWTCQDPPIAENDWARICEAASSGRYGPEEDFTRATIITLTRDIDLKKCREKWKSILVKINPTYDPAMPQDGFLEWASILFVKLVLSFLKFRHTMPASVVRTKKGKVAKRPRHNLIAVNYLMRKLLEMWGDWDCHDEFPVLKTHGKLHALDDVMELMCADLGLKFIRSTVIKRPKLTKK